MSPGDLVLTSSCDLDNATTSVDLSTLSVRQRPEVSGRHLPSPLADFRAAYRRQGEALVAEPFKGVTSDGTPLPGLFPLERTSLSNQPIVAAAASFLDALDDEQGARIRSPIDSDAWRRWSNISPFLMRHGVMFEDMSPEQRERGLGLVASALSEPASDQPWGWQLDGHHLIVSCFVLGDQLVMTPLFMGCEPVKARGGRYKGTRVVAEEEAQGLAFMRSLSPEQQRTATIGERLPIDGSCGRRTATTTART